MRGFEIKGLVGDFFDDYSLIVLVEFVDKSFQVGLEGLEGLHSNWMILEYLCEETEVCCQSAIAIFSYQVHLLASNSKSQLCPYQYED